MGEKVSNYDISSILGIFHLSQILWSFWNASLRNKIGSKNLILLGLFLLMISALCLGLIALSKDGSQFVTFALIARFVMGVGDMMIQMTCYCIVTSIFNDEMLKHIGFLEISSAIGRSIGPFLGGFIIDGMGYAAT